jgi:NAD(P)-dependent dehydrogenase (short-subunit alcohol dehydrogenase family)
VKPVCLVTGAAGRLGSALCTELARTHNVIAVYRSRIPSINSQLRRRIQTAEYDPTDAASNCIHCIQADLANREDLRRLSEVALARFGKIDAIVNAAADTKFYGPLTEVWEADDEAQKQFLINSIAPFQLVSAIHQSSWKDATEENARWNRSVVNVSSASALQVYASQGQAFYSASKAALNMLTMYLSLELAPYSVRANAICPGRFVDAASTAVVVKNIRCLLDGTSTGLVV